MKKLILLALLVTGASLTPASADPYVCAYVVSDPTSTNEHVCVVGDEPVRPTPTPDKPCLVADSRDQDPNGSGEVGVWVCVGL